jgi:hypothetical protein
VQADGYFFCVDLSDRSQIGKEGFKEFDTHPLLQWSFKISTGLEAKDNVLNTTSSKVIANPGGNNLSNSNIVQKWMSIGSSVWTRRYRFSHAVPIMTVDTNIRLFASSSTSLGATLLL